jgi:hypothetical protein
MSRIRPSNIPNAPSHQPILLTPRAVLDRVPELVEGLKVVFSTAHREQDRTTLGTTAGREDVGRLDVAVNNLLVDGGM